MCLSEICFDVSLFVLVKLFLFISPAPNVGQGRCCFFAKLCLRKAETASIICYVVVLLKLFCLKAECACCSIPICFIAIVHANELSFITFGVGVISCRLEVELSEVISALVYSKLEASELCCEICSIVVGSEAVID